MAGKVDRAIPIMDGHAAHLRPGPLLVADGLSGGAHEAVEKAQRRERDLTILAWRTPTLERNKIIYVNAAVETLFGHPADILLGWEDARLTPLLGSNAGVWAGSVTHRDGRQISVTGSTAVATHSERPDRLTYTHVIHDLSAQERMEQWQHLAGADAALYQAKQEGRGCYRLYRQDNDSQSHRGAKIGGDYGR